MKTQFTYIDLFSGIGGFRVAIDALGGKSVGYSEIDRKAVETYKKNFNDPESHDLGDITKLNNPPYADLIVGGVPCQSWSVAGKRRGFDDPRGKLWYDAIRIVDSVKPKAFIFENVKGLMDPRNKENLRLIANSLEDSGYYVHYELLDSYDFGVPQNRSRIYIVGFRSDLEECSASFRYPEPKKGDKRLADFLEGVTQENVQKRKFDPHLIHGGKIPKSRNAFQLDDELNDFFIFCDTRNGHSTVHSWDVYDTTEREKEICMTILKNRRKRIYGQADGNPMWLKDIKKLYPGLTKKELDNLISKSILKRTEDGRYDLFNTKNSSGIDGVYRVFLPNSSIFSTLTATGTKDYIATDYVHCEDPRTYKRDFIEQILKKQKLRRISTREAARIQGFPDDFLYHENEQQAFKQFGNAVSPPVVKFLVEKVVSTGVFKEKSVTTKKDRPDMTVATNEPREEQIPLLG